MISLPGTMKEFPKILTNDFINYKNLNMRHAFNLYKIQGEFRWSNSLDPNNQITFE